MLVLLDLTKGLYLVNHNVLLDKSTLYGIDTDWLRKKQDTPSKSRCSDTSFFPRRSRTTSVYFGRGSLSCLLFKISIYTYS